MKTKLQWILVLSALTPLALSLGCDSPKAALPLSKDTVGTSDSLSEHGLSEHGHAPGQHGGIMVSLGRDSYHVEAVIGSDGAIRLYTLGKDESRVIDVEASTWKGFVKAHGDREAASVPFEPSPQEGDMPNRASLFVGTIPKELVGRDLEVTIPNISINGERFRLGFQSSKNDHSAEHDMPDQLAESEEQQLYLKPMGRYTASDIEANGGVIPSQKFKGIKSAHDMNPKVGDLICPITETKANPKFVWVVDGKPFQFCCPPCIDEFVKSAKSSTDPLASPESYVKK